MLVPSIVPSSPPCNELRQWSKSGWENGMTLLSSYLWNMWCGSRAFRRVSNSFFNKISVVSLRVQPGVEGDIIPITRSR